jgi:hypothetical protein
MNNGNRNNSRILIASISLLVLLGSGLLTSCTKSLNQGTAEASTPVLEGITQSGQETAGTLPYVFEGVMQPGVENAPPVEVVLETELPVVPEKVPIYQVQTVDEEYVYALAKRLGFNYKPSQPTGSSMHYTFLQDRDYEPGIVISPIGSSSIQVYQNGSLRFFTRTSYKGDVNLPSFDEAVKIATDWLTSRDLYPPNVTNVVKGGGTFIGRAIEPDITIQYTMIVQFKTSVGDFDAYSPGASVEVGDNGKIVRAWVNMTQLKEYGAVNTKTPEAALNLLKACLASPLADPPEAKETLINQRSFDKLTVTRVTLQYASGGGYLQPIYVFEGSAYSEKQPNLDAFRGKVDAVAR